MEKGRKTKAPHAFCRRGNEMPIMKLHVHEARLPIDMATERGLPRIVLQIIEYNRIKSVCQLNLKINQPPNY